MKNSKNKDLLLKKLDIANSAKVSKFSYIHILSVFLSLIFVLFCCSCQPSIESYNRPVEGVKFTDIRPMYKNYDPFPAEISAEIIIRKIQIPSGQYALIEDIWTKVVSDKMEFVDKQLFIDNGFKVGSVLPDKWEEIKKELKSVGAEITDSTTMIIDRSISSNFKIKKILQPENYFYKTPYNLFEQFPAQGGSPVWSVRIFDNPQITKTVQVSILPMFIAFEDKNGDMTEKFDILKFAFNADKGYTVILGPDKYEPELSRLKTLFFYNSQKMPTVDIFLISCGKIF